MYADEQCEVIDELNQRNLDIEMKKRSQYQEIEYQQELAKIGIEIIR